MRKELAKRIYLVDEPPGALISETLVLGIIEIALRILADKCIKLNKDVANSPSLIDRGRLWRYTVRATKQACKLNAKPYDKNKALKAYHKLLMAGESASEVDIGQVLNS
jgi:hypothetical protein